MNKPDLLFLCLILAITHLSYAEVATWEGSVSSDFQDSANWNPQIDVLDDAGDVLTIASGSAYDPIYNYSLPTRPNGFNTTEHANFVMTGGELLSYGNNTLNGYVTIKNGWVNMRGYTYIGNGGSGVLTVDGGTFESKYTIYIGRNSGGNGNLNVIEGIVYFSSRPQIGYNGASGHIYLEPGGLCYISGNDTAWFQNLADSGIISTNTGSAVVVEFQAELNRTCITAKKIVGAKLPSPWDNIKVIIPTTISWQPGTLASISYVYVGTEYLQVENASLSDPEYIGSTAGNTISAPELEAGETYYWRVDTVNPWSTIKGTVWSFSPVTSLAPRKMEKIDRGLVAIRNGNSNYIGWRLFGTDQPDIAFNVYRGSVKINSAPVTSSTNFVDNIGSSSATYSISSVIDGQEREFSKSVSVLTDPFYSIDMQQVPGDNDWSYELNDCAVGDLDGDGSYEIVAKRFSADYDEYPVIEAYRLDGTFLWRINLGPNHLSMVEVNPIVYDFDSDGYAEVALRTCEGMTDYSGHTIGDTNNDGITDYRSFGYSPDGYIDAGPEFLSIFDGRTGIELDRTDYIARNSLSQWGDSYGHRANKFHMVVAYLDGYKPSLVICRGIYGLTKMEGWNFRDGKLNKLWHFTSEKWPGYDSQGNHNISVGDVDSDGKDEIVYGGMCVDNDGTGLYTTGLGHGDAIHMGDMLPDRPGLEVWRCIETNRGGATLIDAGTGEILIDHFNEGDIGRCGAAHIDSRYPGYQVWSYAADGTYNSDGSLLSSVRCDNMNFFAWWTGDLQRELLDAVGSTGSNPILNKWNGNGVDRLISFYNIPSSYSTASNNYTKGNPCLSGDILGDWREEILLRSSDNRKLRIFVSTEVTSHRIYTLMHDPQYRLAMAWQCCGYNQPPHPGFYIGEGMNTPPVPYIQLVDDEVVGITPDPARFSIKPEPISDSGITMEAVSGYSLNGDIEYLFTELSGNPGATSSGWQDSPVYTDTGLEQATKYAYNVIVRDSQGNISKPSGIVSVYTHADSEPDFIYYPFEGNAEDAYGYSHATEVGDPVYVSGTTGSQSISFDGSNDYLQLPANIVNTQDITIACWFYLGAANTWQRIFDFGNDTNQYLFLSPNAYGGYLRFAIKDGGSEQILETDSPSTNTWVHVAVTLRGDVGRLYVDGVQVDSGTITLDPSDFNGQVNYIGKSLWPDPLFTGQIDNFYIFKYSLSAAEIASLADIAPPNPISAKFEIEPHMLNISEAGMTAVTGSDISGPVEYLFTEISGNSGGSSSGWQLSNTYIDSGLTPGNQYSYFVTMRDAMSNLTYSSGIFSVIAGRGLFREWWLGVPGDTIDDLISISDYPDNPAGSEIMINFDELSNWNDSYGSRLRGYLMPDFTDTYTLWISGDEAVELYLGSDALSENAELVASVLTRTDQYEWSKYAEQQSEPVILHAGRKYYIEVLQKEGVGDDSLALGWQSSRDNSPKVIQWQYLLPWQERLSGDASGDAKVDMVDTGLISTAWLDQSCDFELEMDVNGDCYIDIKDLEYLVQNWLHYQE